MLKFGFVQSGPVYSEGGGTSKGAAGLVAGQFEFLASCVTIKKIQTDTTAGFRRARVKPLMRKRAHVAVKTATNNMFLDGD
jgi:hypothetical protein